MRLAVEQLNSRVFWTGLDILPFTASGGSETTCAIARALAMEAQGDGF